MVDKKAKAEEFVLNMTKCLMDDGKRRHKVWKATKDLFTVEPLTDEEVEEYLLDTVRKELITYSQLADRVLKHAKLIDRLLDEYKLMIVDTSLTLKVNEDYDDYKDRTCQPMTKECHPDKMSVSEFVGKLRSSLDNFKDNILHLGMEDRYAEEWMKVFAKWMEMC